MDRYYAFVRKDDDSDYGVEFPDLPGCVSAGSIVEEACDGAEDALALHVAGMREDGMAVPAACAFGYPARRCRYRVCRSGAAGSLYNKVTLLNAILLLYIIFNMLINVHAGNIV